MLSDWCFVFYDDLGAPAVPAPAGIGENSGL